MLRISSERLLLGRGATHLPGNRTTGDGGLGGGVVLRFSEVVVCAARRRPVSRGRLTVERETLPRNLQPPQGLALVDVNFGRLGAGIDGGVIATE